jgi:hypothetical protein
MPRIYFSGLNASNLVHENQLNDSGRVLAIDKFISLSYKGMTDIEIGWDYLLIWKNNDLYLSGKNITNDCKQSNRLLKIPEHENLKYECVYKSINLLIHKIGFLFNFKDLF